MRRHFIRNALVSSSTLLSGVPLQQSRHKTYTSHFPCVQDEINAWPSFHELFMSRLEQFSDKTAFHCGLLKQPDVKYGDVAKQIELLTSILYHRYNIRRGDVVALLKPNTLEYGALFHAVLRLGALVTTMNPVMTPEEISKQLLTSKAKLVITIPVFEPVILKAIAHLTVTHDNCIVPKVYGKAHADCSELIGGNQLDKVSSFQAVPASELYNATGKPNPDDTIVLPFSSGTTGMPKGVQLTNRNLVANIFQTQTALMANENDVMMSVLPFFHIYGMIVLLHGMLNVGASQVILPSFDMKTYLEQMEKKKATFLAVAPPILVGFVKHPLTQTVDRSRVRLMICGAAPLGKEIQEMCEPLFPNAKIVQGYGLTETSPVLSCTPQDQLKYGSAGKLVPNTEMRVIHVDKAVSGDHTDPGEDVPVGDEGELWVRGPQVMKGYLREEDTQQVMRPGGWFRTGDVVKVDPDGFIFVTDRLKELIKYKGYQVAPAELEAIIQTHPFVMETIVVGIPTGEKGSGNEVPRAHVVLKPTVSKEDAANAANAIVEYVKGKVSDYKQLRGGIKIVDAIPKTASGKLLRRVVKAQEVAEAAQS